MQIKYAAPGKLNLFLKVTGRRDDGYHELASVFYPVKDICDLLTMDISGNGGGENSIRVKCNLPEVPEDLGNIAGRAAQYYLDEAGISGQRVEIFIEKHIFAAAGMGGGSSDGAAVLKMMDEYFHALNPDLLKKTALRLGADVPYFLSPAAAQVHGIGEIIEAADFETPSLPVVIFNPGFPVSAKWAYCNLPEQVISPDCGGCEAMLAALCSGSAQAVAAAVHNDLAIPVKNKFPIVDMLCSFMERNGALRAEMTGSGPTVFGICQDEESAGYLRKALAAFSRTQ